MRSRVLKGRLLPVVLAFGMLAVSVTVGGATAGGGHRHARDVTSKVDAAVAQKLSPDLQQQVDADATAPVKVVVSLQASSLPQATNLLQELPANGRPRRLRTFPTVRRPYSVAVDPVTGRVFVTGMSAGVVQLLDP